METQNISTKIIILLVTIAALGYCLWLAGKSVAKEAYNQGVQVGASAFSASLQQAAESSYNSCDPKNPHYFLSVASSTARYDVSCTAIKKTNILTQ